MPGNGIECMTKARKARIDVPKSLLHGTACCLSSLLVCLEVALNERSELIVLENSKTRSSHPLSNTHSQLVRLAGLCCISKLFCMESNTGRGWNAEISMERGYFVA